MHALSFVASAAEAFGWPEATMAKEHTFTIPATRPAAKNATTLVTQFTVGRLARFQKIAAAWPGPISAVMYFYLIAFLTFLYFLNIFSIFTSI